METKVQKKYIGVDVASVKLDIFYEKKHQVFTNNQAGFEKIKLMADRLANFAFVVEETGNYDDKLLYQLHGYGFEVYTIRAFDAKQAANLFGPGYKTDKTDAKLLSDHGHQLPINRWFPPNQAIKEAKELSSLQEYYIAQKTAAQNRLHSAKFLHEPNKMIIEEIKDTIKHYEDKIKKLQKEEENILRKEAPEQFKLLISIPGVGKKTACLLIRESGNFRVVPTAKKLIAYVGYNPCLYQSGKNQNPSGRISKKGNGKSRSILFMASLSASWANKQCKDKYERALAAGKAKKKALVAVIDKMIHQAYAVIASGKPYDPEFISKKSA